MHFFLSPNTCQNFVYFWNSKVRKYLDFFGLISFCLKFSYAQPTLTSVLYTRQEKEAHTSPQRIYGRPFTFLVISRDEKNGSLLEGKRKQGQRKWKVWMIRIYLDMLLKPETKEDQAHPRPDFSTIPMRQMMTHTHKHPAFHFRLHARIPL